MKRLEPTRGRLTSLMQRTVQMLACALIASLVLASGCSGKSGSGGGTTVQSTQTRDLDLLMRTRMNASYSQLVYLVFHAEGEHDYAKITEESARLTEAVATVLKLGLPPQVTSDQARHIYIDYNETLRRDNEKFSAATAAKDFETMSSSLTKMGETCSACHHFFRIKVPDAAE